MLPTEEKEDTRAFVVVMNHPNPVGDLLPAPLMFTLNDYTNIQLLWSYEEDAEAFVASPSFDLPASVKEKRYGRARGSFRELVLS
jgi:hypothetical protein